LDDSAAFSPRSYWNRCAHPGRGAVLPALSVALLVAVATPARAPDSGTMAFIATQMGTPLQGSFEDFTVRLDFDPAHPERGSVHAQVPLASVSAGSREANELLRSAGFFDAAHFPQATFDAVHFAAPVDGLYRAQGSFALKGHTVTVPVQFTVNSDPQGLWLDGSFSISRLEFGVGQGEWSDTSTLDDAVRVVFHIPQPRAAR